MFCLLQKIKFASLRKISSIKDKGENIRKHQILGVVVNSVRELMFADGCLVQHPFQGGDDSYLSILIFNVNHLVLRILVERAKLYLYVATSMRILLAVVFLDGVLAVIVVVFTMFVTVIVVQRPLKN